MTLLSRAPAAILLSIGLTSAVLLAYQIAATRVLSATTSYHAAFAVIALVMLGLAASGTRLYIHRKERPVDTARTPRALVWGAASLVVGMVAVVLGNAIPAGEYQVWLATLSAVAAFYPPFYFAGYAISSILTDYADDIARVYWADLVAAAAGCVLVIPALSFVTPIQLGLGCAVLLSVAALAASRAFNDFRRPSTVATGVTMVIFAVALAVPDLTHLRRAKGVLGEPLGTAWNHLNRVSVYPELPSAAAAVEVLGSHGIEGTPKELGARAGIGWGLSMKYAGPTPDIRYLLLDQHAGTPIIEGGPEANLEILKWDITSIGYWTRETPPERVFIVGGGGGRDILTALSFGVPNVDVVELNPGVVELVDETMGDYSGKPYSAPGVNLEVGDARGVLSRADHQYDLIQMSMIDTWASSSSGAMVLTENVLYTREAFDVYRAKLADDGILSVVRWYHPDTYGELGRLLATIGDSLERGGIDEPEKHLFVAYAPGVFGGYASTALMKKSTFTEAELATLREVSDRMGFTVLWPAESPEIDVLNLLEGVSPEGGTRLDLDPATDNRPFFFNRYRPFGSYLAAIQDGQWERVSPATTLLLFLLAIAILLGRIFVTGPLRQHGEGTDDFPWWAWVYFACLGLGFLSVELALIQRLTIYLGHPTYALTIVLSTLLLFGGIGSYLSRPIVVVTMARWAAAAVLVSIAFTAFALPPILAATESWELLGRQALAVAATLPVGISLGMMYPSGIRLLVDAKGNGGVPWAWAINGVWGVIASILGMIVAMAFGYGALLVLSALAYAVALYVLGRFE